MASRTKALTWLTVAAPVRPMRRMIGAPKR